MQVLYTMDLNHQSPDDALRQFWHSEGAAEDERTFTDRLVRGVSEHAEDIDAVLKKCAQNWDIARMSKTDRNVMRLSIFEMLYCSDIPPVVSINEAVDIAKRYGDTKSGKFVNGILDRIRKDLKRPAREAVQEDLQALSAPLKRGEPTE
jgi:transcription antitermination protein NusB